MKKTLLLVAAGFMLITTTHAQKAEIGAFYVTRDNNQTSLSTFPFVVGQEIGLVTPDNVTLNGSTAHITQIEQVSGVAYGTSKTKITLDGNIKNLTEASKGKKERKLRKELETLHASPSADKVSFIVKNLDHSDRAIRFSARVALEHLDYAHWKDEIKKDNSSDKEKSSVILSALIKS